MFSKVYSGCFSYRIDVGRQGQKLRDDLEDKSQEGEDDGLDQECGSELLRIGQVLNSL